jgi:two-component system cell cycle response regulator CpdR
MARILLAEDDDQLRAFLGRGLRRAGHAVDAVADGEAALVQAHDADYDLLVADVVMPGIDGIELARRVSVRQPGIRVMFITGFAAVAVRDEDFTPKRPRVLAKPFHLRHLIAGNRGAVIAIGGRCASNSHLLHFSGCNHLWCPGGRLNT